MGANMGASLIIKAFLIQANRANFMKMLFAMSTNIFAQCAKLNVVSAESFLARPCKPARRESDQGLTMENWQERPQMSAQDSNQTDLKVRIEEELQKAQETTSTLKHERQVPEKTLHETFTL